MNKETTFNFIIQSHSRTKEVVRLVKNINELKSHNINFNIILSDNGNRNFDDFKIHNRSVEYINSNDCSSPYMHVFRIFSLESEKPKLGISSLVSLRLTFELCFLHISATSFTVTVSLVKLKISEEISSLSSINLKHQATSINGTRLLTCLPPANNLSVPS